MIVTELCYLDRGSYRMEDWLHFVETFSAYVFAAPVLHSSILRELWGHLVAAVDHYFRPAAGRSIDEVAAERRTGHAHLVTYAKMMERLWFPDRMFTYNLHLAVCRCVV